MFKKTPTVDIHSAFERAPKNKQRYYGMLENNRKIETAQTASPFQVRILRVRRLARGNFFQTPLALAQPPPPSFFFQIGLVRALRACHFPLLGVLDPLDPKKVFDADFSREAIMHERVHSEGDPRSTPKCALFSARFPI